MEKEPENKYKVVVLDLTTARTDIALNTYGTKVWVYKADSAISIKFNTTDSPSIDIPSGTVPKDRLIFEDFEFNEIYVTNSAATGQAIIIVFYREK